MKVKFEIEENLVPLLRESLAFARDARGTNSTGSKWLDGIYTSSLNEILASIGLRSRVPNELDGLAEGYTANFDCGGFTMNVRTGVDNPEIIEALATEDNEFMNSPMGAKEPKLSRKRVQKTGQKLVPVAQRKASPNMRPDIGTVAWMTMAGAPNCEIRKVCPQIPYGTLTSFNSKYAEEIAYMKTLGETAQIKYLWQRFGYSSANGPSSVSWVNDVRLPSGKKLLRKTGPPRIDYSKLPDFVPALMALRADGLDYKVCAVQLGIEKGVARGYIASCHKLWKELQETPYGQARYVKLRGWFPQWKGVVPMTLDQTARMGGFAT